MTAQPFSDELRRVARRMNYAEMARACGYRYSATTLRGLAQNPGKHPAPHRRTLPGLAQLLGLSEHRVAELVCQQWYGMSEPVLNPTAQVIARLIDNLPEDLLRAQLNRLTVDLIAQEMPRQNR